MGEIIYCIIFIAAILAILGNKQQKGVVRMIVGKVVMKYVRPSYDYLCYCLLVELV